MDITIHPMKSLSVKVSDNASLYIFVEKDAKVCVKRAVDLEMERFVMSIDLSFLYNTPTKKIVPSIWSPKHSNEMNWDHPLKL